MATTLPATALPLVNEALTLMGERPFVMFDDPSILESQRAFESVYETALRSLFSRTRWKGNTVTLLFSTALALPRALGTAPTDPTDALAYTNAVSDVGHPCYPSAWSFTPRAGVENPVVLRIFSVRDINTRGLLPHFDYGLGVINTPASVTAGVYVTCSVRPPETLIAGYTRDAFVTELASRVAVRITGKVDLAQSLRARAADAYRLARHHEGVTQDNLPEHYGMNPYDKTDIGDNASWLTARI